jgi:Sec-independent protein translocase protein TatA
MSKKDLKWLSDKLMEHDQLIKDLYDIIRELKESQENITINILDENYEEEATEDEEEEEEVETEEEAAEAEETEQTTLPS